MKIKGAIAGGLALATTLFAMGCGGADGGVQLSQAQAMQIASDVIAATGGASVSLGGTAVGLRAPGVVAHLREAQPTEAELTIPPAQPNALPQANTAPVTVTISPFTFTCPAGGSIVVSGSVTVTDNSTQSAANFAATEAVTETMNHCVHNGLTLDGNPNVTLTGSLSLLGNVFTDRTTIAGNVLVNGTRNCAINVSLFATVNTTTQAVSGTESGSVCGIAVNATL